MNRILLEVCIESADDAATAAACGANRLELNAALCLGGITPSLGLLQEVRNRIGPTLPLVAMIRPRNGNFCYTAAEFDTMRRDVDFLLAQGANGIAFGILTPERRIDVPRCRSLVEQVLAHSAASEGVVFHRAFDFAADPLSSLDQLAAMGVRRVLTSGQSPTALEGAHEIARYIRHAGSRIEILPGAGIRPENLAELIRRTGCRQVHGSFREACGPVGGMVSPETAISLAAAAEIAASATSGRLLGEMVEQLRRLGL